MHHKRNSWCNQQENHTEAPVHPEKHGKNADNSQTFAQHHGNGVGGCAFDLRHIISHFGNQTTNAVLVVVTYRHTQQLIQNLLTQFVHNIVGDVFQRITAHKTANTTDNHNQHTENGTENTAFSAARFYLVNGPAQPRRNRCLAGGINDVTEYTDKKDAQIGTHVTQQALVYLKSGNFLLRLVLWHVL